MKKYVLFIHGAGEGAYQEDRLLAESLQRALGSEYEVRCPSMRTEANPDYTEWKSQIAAELANANGEVILVGHSLGGSILIKYLSEQAIAQPVAGLSMLAAPFWGDEGDWQWDAVKLPENFADKLTGVRRIYLYQSRDDEIVPFAHLAEYAARLPRAIVREVNGGGHQFGNDLIDVARDIKAM